MNNDHKSSHSVLPRGAVWPFILLSSCFLWWAIANNLTDPLVRVFKDIFGMSTFQASLIQMAFYGGYFCMALPGAMVARKFTYKTGVLLGLGLYAAGCFLLYPAMLAESFLFFCVAYYVLACGLGILETNANPYVMALGSEKSATRRLNFAQSFNPIGAVLGIVLAQTLIFANLPQDGAGELAIPKDGVDDALNTVIFPYLAIATVLAVVWVLILVTRMPEASDEDNQVHFAPTLRRLLRNRNYLFSVFSQFCYVGTQISVWTYTNFYIPTQLGVSQEVALRYHTAALILFGVSRWIFTTLMRYYKASNLLVVSSVLAVAACGLVIFVGGIVGVYALVFVSGCMSLMFPTIFGLGCADLGEDTKLASSGQIMAIVGGAIITPIQGALVDSVGVSLSYILPLLCFVVIGVFAWTNRKHEEHFSSQTHVDLPAST